jgi:20S proteasome alpha/beta subunit
MCYDNKDQLSAGIIVAGWDKENGGSVYNIPLGGGMFQQPWAIGGEHLGITAPYSTRSLRDLSTLFARTHSIQIFVIEKSITIY